MQLLPSQPVSIGKILDTSIKLYTASFTKLLGFFLIMAVFYVSLGLFSDQLLSGQPTNPADVSAFMLAKMPMLMSVIFIASLLTFVFYIAMIYRIDNVANQRDDDFIEALVIGFKKFPAVLVAVILYTIVVMVGFIMLVVPGIILSLSLAFYIYFIVLDSLGGYASLKASHNLIKGNWWRTMTVFMAPSIIMMAIYFPMIMLADFVGANNNTLISVVTNLLSAFITPYFFTLAYVQFHDLKLRTSGSDLQQRLAK